MLDNNNESDHHMLSVLSNRRIKMKKFVIILGGVTAVIILAVVIFLAYLGMFSNYEPTEKEMGPYTFVYEKFVGPYKDTGSVFNRVDKKLNKVGIKSTMGMGIYFDNPSKVDSSKLRSECGSVIGKKDIESFNKVKDSFNVKTVEKSKSVVVTFPIKNGMSYMIGPMKCYPILTKYSKEKGLKLKGNAFELYDIPGKIIYYVFPVDNN